MNELRTLVLLVSAAFAFVLPAVSQSHKASAPCISATSDCTQRVLLKGGPAHGLVYSTYSLTVPNPAIHRALIMVHGVLRNPDHYFRTATTAAFMAGALNDTIVIAPGFLSDGKNCKDKLERDQVNWGCGGDNFWRDGTPSLTDKDLTSFDFVDEILRRLADKRNFPNLKAIVIAGHSAGGVFVTLYEMSNRVADTLGVPVSYVVGNPSLYAWPDALRPLQQGDAAPDNAALGWKEETPHTNFIYGPFDPVEAPGYDLWPFGLEKRNSGYTVGISDDQLRKQLVSRPTTYLLSQVDTLPLGGFLDSPPAMAQGSTRRARGEAFFHYINQRRGAHAKILIVPECGHNDRCVYTADAVLPVIFP
jgi:pimeloyl-ACP methyl ester carboxylesterase